MRTTVTTRLGRRRQATRAAVIAAVIVLALTGALDPATAQQHRGSTIGAPGVGDPYFPSDGNGGYDALHYDVRVTTSTDARSVRGDVVMTARTTSRLSRFDLDLHGLEVDSVRVDGRPATWGRFGDHELVITPAAVLAQGRSFQVQVRYHGEPGIVVTPDGFENGWFATSDGATAVGQPPSAMVWMPVNEHPSDKALYDVSVTVPRGLAAISNGQLVSRDRRPDGAVTWSWHVGHPMASYLLVLSIGTFDIRTSTTADGIRILDAVDPSVDGAADAALAREGEVIHVLSRAFGPYPFRTAGAIVDNLDVGYALETQTRPFYSAGFFSGSPDDAWVVAHEIAHQWYGDSVALERWSDIWLNEGFATYAEWLWAEHDGQGTPADVMAGILADVPADDPLWSVDISDPGPLDLFADAVYVRGGLVLQALREHVGDKAFFTILRSWAKEHRDGNATTAEFISLAQHVSGKNLTGLFQTWLFTPAKPAAPAVAAARMGSGSRVASSAAVSVLTHASALGAAASAAQGR